MLTVATPVDTTDRSETIEELRVLLGSDVIHRGHEADLARHRRDFTNGSADDFAIPAVAYPRTTEQVSTIMRVCNRARVPVVPQGGLTGMAGGAVPIGPALLLSLERMRGVEELDADGRTITVQAGTVLEAVQQAADAAGLLFPLDLGGRGTAQVGGNAATNAGGNRVLRYGMMRELVLGLEVVLADGTVLTSLNRMLKNNAGYDLKHLFIGSEGTLGIITRLVLRLFPKPRSACTALVAVDDYPAAIALLREAGAAFGGALAAFELMWPEFYALGTVALGRQPPLPEGHGIYVLLETFGTDQERDAILFEQTVGTLLESGLVRDAVVATSDRQVRELWAIRECPGEFPKIYWPQIGFDVSLPIGCIGDFAEECRARLEARWPDIRTVRFGHLADCNLHLSVNYPHEPVPVQAIEATVYEAVGEWGGSISAEHGIGSLKRDFLRHSRTPAELTLMRQLKAMMDPNNILNPGKVI